MHMAELSEYSNLRGAMGANGFSTQKDMYYMSWPCES